MAAPYLDHPGEIHWFSGYQPAPVAGPCPHTWCEHRGQSVIAWGPDMRRYVLMQCDADCGTRCRAWADGRDVITTPWLNVPPEFADFSLLRARATIRA